MMMASADPTPPPPVPCPDCDCSSGSIPKCMNAWVLESLSLMAGTYIFIQILSRVFIGTSSGTNLANCIRGLTSGNGLVLIIGSVFLTNVAIFWGFRDYTLGSCNY